MISNLEHYKVFYYVGKCKSLTRAAEEMMISQPAVSQAMKQLERNVGSRLFSRSSKGVRLTPEGEVLYNYVKNGYEQIALGEKVLEKLMNLEAGEVRIGASDMTLQYYLLPYLEKFHEKYPDIKVYVTNGPTPETVQCLEEGVIDFGIVSTPFQEKKGLLVRPVKEIEDVFVAGHKYIHLKNHMTDFHELPDYPMIFLDRNTSTRRYIDSLLEENGIVLHPEFELSTSDMIVQFALRNLGIGCVMRDFALPHIETGKLFELRFNKMIKKRQFCIITEEGVPVSAAAKKLLELFGEPLEEKFT